MMDEKRLRVLGLSLFILALGVFLFYRPVLRVIGIDLDRAVPEWADFFTPRQYEAFLKEVRGYFRAEDLAVRIGNDKAYPEDGGEYGLKYVAQLCHQAKRAEWTEIVRAHFDRLLIRADRPVSAPEKGRHVRPMPKTP